MRLSVTLSVQKIMATLVAALVLLLLGQLTTFYLRMTPGYEDVPGIGALIELLNWDGEANLPSWYSSTLLLIAAALLAQIGLTPPKNQWTLYWRSLSAIFVALSVDETASIHEHLNGPMRSLLNTEGYLYFAWVVPGALFVGGLGLLYWRFWRALPPTTRLRILLAGALYVTGALGFEVPGSYFYQSSGLDSPFFILLSTLEELLEMGGILIFIHTLLLYLTPTQNT